MFRRSGSPISHYSDTTPCFQPKYLLQPHTFMLLSDWPRTGHTQRYSEVYYNPPPHVKNEYTLDTLKPSLKCYVHSLTLNPARELCAVWLFLVFKCFLYSVCSSGIFMVFLYALIKFTVKHLFPYLFPNVHSTWIGLDWITFSLVCPPFFGLLGKVGCSFTAKQWSLPSSVSALGAWLIGKCLQWLRMQITWQDGTEIVKTLAN